MTAADNLDRIALFDQWRKEGTLGQMSVSDVLALVEIARAAQATHPTECPDESCLHPSCRLARALARLNTKEET